MGKWDSDLLYRGALSRQVLSMQGLQEKLWRRNKTAIGPRKQTETSLKIGIWGPGYNVNVSDDQQPEFRSLSEFYIIIFLNKLKIVEKTPQNGTKSE
jgi:hypothetical protein